MPGTLPPPLTIYGRDPARAVSFSVPLFLAPMEGVTDPCFRDLVIDLGGVGGACTEFIRISVSPVSRKVVRRHLGAPRTDCPVAVQLMASEETFLAESVAAAEAEGASYIDLNFGCPVPVVFKKCAGSALLRYPERLCRLVSAAAGATGLPVSAKVRAGIDSPAHLEEIILACAEGGAAMLTLHARLRIHSYAHPACWEWIARAKEILARSSRPIPLIGNGGVERPEDFFAMLKMSGCDGVMIGRGALADPWIFSQIQGGRPPTASEAAAFALRYADTISAAQGTNRALAKLKQLVRYFRAGGLLADQEEERRALLRMKSLSELRAWFLRIRHREAGGDARPEAM